MGGDNSEDKKSEAKENRFSAVERQAEALSGALNAMLSQAQEEKRKRGAERTCSRCTFANAEGWKVCAVCESKRSEQVHGQDADLPRVASERAALARTSDLLSSAQSAVDDLALANSPCCNSIAPLRLLAVPAFFLAIRFAPLWLFVICGLVLWFKRVPLARVIPEVERSALHCLNRFGRNRMATCALLVFFFVCSQCFLCGAAHSRHGHQHNRLFHF